MIRKEHTEGVVAHDITLAISCTDCLRDLGSLVQKMITNDIIEAPFYSF